MDRVVLEGIAIYTIIALIIALLIVVILTACSAQPPTTNSQSFATGEIVLKFNWPQQSDSLATSQYKNTATESDTSELSVVIN